MESAKRQGRSHNSNLYCHRSLNTPATVTRLFALLALNGERFCLSRFRSVLAKRNGAVCTAPQFTKPEGEMRLRLRTFPIKLVHGKNVVRVKPRRYSYYTGDHCLNSLFLLCDGVNTP